AASRFTWPRAAAPGGALTGFVVTSAGMISFISSLPCMAGRGPGVMIDRVVSGFHDRDTGSHAAASVAARARVGDDVASGACAPNGDIDVLSDLLRRVRLSASMLFLVEASQPW